MRVCVVGLWHLGTVTAACLAEGGHEVVGLDFDAEAVARLREGKPPLFEPGLEDLVRKGLAAGRLSFTDQPQAALARAQVIWIAFDTPVDDEDRADVEFVRDRVRRLFPFVEADTLVLISSQMPVGSTRRLAGEFAACPGRPVGFGYSPENLRLGKAISVFTQPDRVVVGLARAADRPRVRELLKPFTERIEWMTVESAEMTKHALNAFLATSVTFINELAILCERTGADAKEVKRGLSEARIGPKAYLGPGGAFAGGTLARDVNFLVQLGSAEELPTPLLSGVLASNAAHKHWARRQLTELLAPLAGKTVALWGLTYKPNTDTLRRSMAVELCRWLIEQGAHVRAHDPAVKTLPDDLAGRVLLAALPLEAAQGADALVVATEWPQYRDVPAAAVATALRSMGVPPMSSTGVSPVANSEESMAETAMRRTGETPVPREERTPVVLDANRFLGQTLGGQPGIRYIAVGAPRGARRSS